MQLLHSGKDLNGYRGILPQGNVVIHTTCYLDPLVKVNTIQIDVETDKITDFIKPATGNLCMLTGDADLGRISVFTNTGRHPGSSDMVCMKDANGNSFALNSPTFLLLVKQQIMEFFFP